MWWVVSNKMSVKTHLVDLNSDKKNKICLNRRCYYLLFFMPRNQIEKEEMKTRVLKLKNQLYNESYMETHKELAHKYLNEVLNIIEEYRY